MSQAEYDILKDILAAIGGGITTAAKAEDTARVSGDYGAAVQAVQKAVPGDEASEADYAFLQMSRGRLHTQALEGLSASATFTPAANSHTANDSVGVAQQFALGAPAGSSFLIRSVSLLIAGPTIETTAWKLHLFSVTPPSALADDAPFVLPAGDLASYLGYVAIPQVVDLVDNLWIDSNNIFKQVKLAAAGTSLFGYLTNDTTLTPQAVGHTVTINGSPV